MSARSPRPFLNALGFVCLTLLAPALTVSLAGCGEEDRSGEIPYVPQTDAEKAAVDAEENG